MARKPRIQYAGALYHVMCRGNRGADIFMSDKDRNVFLETLGEVCSQTGWRVHAYVLMGNHYHLLLETPEANLVAGMKWFQGTYTQRFNARNKMWGHLFQGRYKALIIDPAVDDYFSVVSSYIHLNPVRARLPELLEGKLVDYAWSSYPAYVGQSKREDWLCVKRVMGAYGVRDNTEGKIWYQQYMQKRCAEICTSSNPMEADPNWEAVRQGWYLGDDTFQQYLTEAVDKEMDGKSRDSFTGDPKRLHDEHAADELLGQGLGVLDLSADDLKSLNKSDARKQVLAWFLRSRTSVSTAWVAEQLCMGHRVNVSRAMAIVRDSDDNGLVEIKDRVLKCTH